MLELGYSEKEATEMRAELVKVVLERRTSRPWGAGKMPDSWRDPRWEVADGPGMVEPSKPQAEDNWVPAALAVVLIWGAVAVSYFAGQTRGPTRQELEYSAGSFYSLSNQATFSTPNAR